MALCLKKVQRYVTIRVRSARASLFRMSDHFVRRGTRAPARRHILCTPCEQQARGCILLQAATGYMLQAR